MKKILLLCTFLVLHQSVVDAMNEDAIAQTAYDAASEYRAPAENTKQDECCICLNEYNVRITDNIEPQRYGHIPRAIVLPCNKIHTVCDYCLKQLIDRAKQAGNQNITCPLCREAINIKSFHNYSLWIEGGIAVLFGIAAERCFADDEASTGQKCARGAGYLAALAAAQVALNRYNQPRTTGRNQIAGSWITGLTVGYFAAHSMRESKHTNQRPRGARK